MSILTAAQQDREKLLHCHARKIIAEYSEGEARRIFIAPKSPAYQADLLARLRIHTISKRVRESGMIATETPFLDYWKQGIEAMPTTDAFYIAADAVEEATCWHQLPPLGTDHLPPIMDTLSDDHRLLLGLMATLYYPQTGEQLCRQYNIRIGHLVGLNDNIRGTVIGLLHTYKGY